jgi:hypothetical protein
MISVHYKLFLKLTNLVFLALIISNCGKLKSSDDVISGINKRVSLDYNGPNEPSYCTSPILYSNSITITGSASYEYRLLVSTSQFKGLGDIAEDPKPIRYAEFVVINNFGNVIQCGETDVNGGFSFQVPSNGQVYRLQVRSRADNNFYKASIMRSPESNQLYNIESAFTANSSQTIDLVAAADGNLLGGAFNILDQIYEYNDKLRTLAGTCVGTGTGCTPFVVAQKVSVYWEKGFNPGSYLAGSPATSFYYKGLSRLFLLGGINGDVDYSDTDHFDNSIIAHEYFHFLEDIYSHSDSPGGSHNGNQLIDPRLAWSEGVAQFFQAVMTGINRVIDTVGNIDGASQFIVNYSVETAENDIPAYEGEGEFREFSVARMLWDMQDDTNLESSTSTACGSLNTGTGFTDRTSNYALSQDKCPLGGFVHFWATITGSLGFNDSTARFISSGLFHQRYLTNITVSDRTKNLLPLAVYEKQAQNRIRYGQRLTTSSCGSPSALSMSTPFVTNVSGQLINNNPATNNRYYYIQHGGGTLAVELTYAVNVTPDTGLSAQLDLYLYPESYTISGTSPIVANTNTGSPKSITVSSNLAAGFYLILVNVRNFNSANGTIDFTLRSGATLGTLGNLCTAL